jgi:hypothetical protein
VCRYTQLCVLQLRKRPADWCRDKALNLIRPLSALNPTWVTEDVACFPQSLQTTANSALKLAMIVSS